MQRYIVRKKIQKRRAKYIEKLIYVHKNINQRLYNYKRLIKYPYMLGKSRFPFLHLSTESRPTLKRNR